MELSEFDCQCHEKSACGLPCIQCQLDADIRGDAYAHQFTALGGYDDMADVYDAISEDSPHYWC